MNTKRKFSAILSALAVAMLFFYSCSKDDSGSISPTDLALAQDDAFAYAVYEEVDNMVIEEITGLDAAGYGMLSLKSTTDEIPCYTVNVDFPDSTRFPKVVTLNYGDGCTYIFREDTITRKGSIRITITDRWFAEGAQFIVTFIDFSINDVFIEGTKTLTNEGFNDDGNLLLSMNLEGGKITFPDSTFMTLDAGYVKEWIRHMTPLNDTLIITGSAAGMNVLGEEYSRTITEPLVLVHCREYNLRWVIVAGKVEINNSTSGLTTIDYSANGCDGTVIVNKNGYRHNYFFKYNHRHHHRQNRQ